MSAVAGWGGWAVAGLGAGLLLAGLQILAGRRRAVARACHELRGPLGAVRLGLALGARTGELTPERLRAIDVELGRAALALEDLTAAGRRPPRLHRVEAVDVCALVADSVEAWRPAALRAGVPLHAAGEVRGGTVWGDQLRLAQALGNLLANAIEHGGGVVEVRVAARAGLVRVAVSDQGAGLPAPITELARRARRARGAHGHGLAVAAGVAEAHGGRLSAAPASVGARLVLELPAAAGS